MANGGAGLIPMLLSVTLAAGVYLTYDGLVRPRPAPTAAPRLVAVREFLVRAGLREVTPRDFVVFCVGAGALAGLLAQLFLGWGVLSALAAVGGLLAPYAYYRRRHDQRRAAIEAA